MRLLTVDMDVGFYSRSVLMLFGIALSSLAGCSGLKGGIASYDAAVWMLDGFWNGSTTDGDRPINFEIRGGSLAMLRFDWNAKPCGTLGSTETRWSPATELFDRDAVTRTDED